VLPIDLLEQLADGHEHSRSRLRDSLGLDAEALDRQLDRLVAAGLPVITATSDSLRLAESIDWMEAATIESLLTRRVRACIESLERSFELESTNRHLLAQRPPALGKARIAIAEYQSAGRGRRGRQWLMPPGSGIALSVSWAFQRTPSDFAAFSLAVGTMARRAIIDVTGLDIGLKWPNDLIVDSGKLGGILVELARLEDGTCHVVAGIGINVKVPAAFLAQVSDFSHGARDIARQVPEWAIDRAALTAALIERFMELFTGFADTGFEPYRAEWIDAHVLAGQAIELRSGSGTQYATVRGIDTDGALIVEDENGARRSVISGDVTIRVQRDAGD
jgi:BirA family biotin operon repressor/biotin-[acetyl-CoA-carboxylase] ligase